MWNDSLLTYVCFDRHVQAESREGMGVERAGGSKGEERQETTTHHTTHTHHRKEETERAERHSLYTSHIHI